MDSNYANPTAVELTVVDNQPADQQRRASAETPADNATKTEKGVSEAQSGSGFKPDTKNGEKKCDRKKFRHAKKEANKRRKKFENRRQG